jgi:hypothetical protein
MTKPYSGSELAAICVQIREEFPSQGDCLHSWHGPSGVIEISLARLEETAKTINALCDVWTKAGDAPCP